MGHTESGGGHTHFLRQTGGEGSRFGGLCISVKAFQIQATIVQTYARGDFAPLIPCFFPPTRRGSTNSDMSFDVRLPGANEERRAATNDPLSSYTNHCHFVGARRTADFPLQPPPAPGRGAANLSHALMTGMTPSPPPEGSGEAP